MTFLQRKICILPLAQFLYYESRYARLEQTEYVIMKEVLLSDGLNLSLSALLLGLSGCPSGSDMEFVSAVDENREEVPVLHHDGTPFQPIKHCFPSHSIF